MPHDLLTIQTQWVVITGGPSSGKTTTVEDLKKRGFHSSPESARTLIDLGMRSGLMTEQVRRDEPAFNEGVLHLQLGLEHILVPEMLCFHDRGLPDSLAYLRLYGGDESFAYVSVRKRTYKAVFLLDLLPFKKDYARTEDANVARYIDQLIYETYEELGYSVTRVPVLSVKERSEFIIKTLGLLEDKIA